MLDFDKRKFKRFDSIIIHSKKILIGFKSRENGNCFYYIFHMAISILRYIDS